MNRAHSIESCSVSSTSPMSIKRGTFTKDFSREREDTLSRKEETADEKVRILQDNLVFVNALPADTPKEELEKKNFFGRYGKVTKLILNPPYPNKKALSHQAYVTYQNELDAAIAIVSLDGYKLEDRPLKVSFGTTKYCSHFLRGHQCPNADCFYLHEFDRKREVHADNKAIFKEQNTKALRIVLARLEEVAARVIEEEQDQDDLEGNIQGFPLLAEVLDYLVDKESITQAELDRAYQQAHARSSFAEPQQPPPLEIRGTSLPDPAHERQSQRLNKSNSHSTMCTPAKNNETEQNLHKPSGGKQAKASQSTENQVVQIGLAGVREGLKQKCQQLMHQLRENIVVKQNMLGARELQMQEKIEKLIIREILRKGNTECRSRFMKVTAPRQELTKIRGIVQKHLIAHH